MNYIQIVNLISYIAYIVLSLLMLHFAVFAIVGLFKRKKYPHTEKINRYGIIIPARNEEKVVAGLIDSIRKNNYPQDKLEIFVIAHNCTDKTAEIARSMGVNVYEYNNPKECTMGYAFKYLFEQIEKDFKTSSFDGFFLFNADNIVSKNYFEKMNDAFEFYDKKYVITSFRNSKNYGSNLISGLYGIYFMVGCMFESRGRTVCGCSTRVQGTGYVINSKCVKNGWPYVTLTEDWEFSVDQILLNNKIRFCDEAVFYDEQPTTIKIMWRQRVRWSRGHLLVFYARIKDLIKNLFGKKIDSKISLYDITINILPIGLIMIAITLFQIIFLLLTPCFSDLTLYEAFISENHNLLTSNGYLFVLAKSTIFSYIGGVISAIIVFIAEHKRVKNVKFINKVLLTLLWPVFIFIQFPMDIQALFSRNLGWKPIPHDDKTTLSTIDKK